MVDIVTTVAAAFSSSEVGAAPLESFFLNKAKDLPLSLIKKNTYGRLINGKPG